MKRIALSALAILLLAAGLAHANGRGDVIGVSARKGAIARYLNQVEGLKGAAKQSFAQRGGQLGNLVTGRSGAALQMWSTSGPAVAPPNGGPTATPAVWPAPAGHSGQIEIAKPFKGQRVTIFPVIMMSGQ